MPRGLDTPLQDMDAGECRRLRAARRALALSAAGAVAAAGLSAAALVALLLPRPLVDPGVATLALVLGLAWAWLLRGSPRRWLDAGRDLRAGKVAQVEGPGSVRASRGIGLLAPLHHRLLVAGRRFELHAAQADLVGDGRVLRVRFAPRSGVLLGHEACEALPRAAQVAPRLRVEPNGLLTPRESELLSLIAQGLSDKAIARILGLGPATVRTYNSQLYGKLGARSRTEAVARARALGLLTDVED